MPAGYRPDVIPATCPNGHTYYPTAFVMRGQSQVIQHTPTSAGFPCPHCGAKGTIAPGHYACVDGAVQRIGDA